MRSVKDTLNNETVFSRADFGNLLTVKKFDNSGNLLRETVTAKDLVGRVTSYTIKVPEGEDVNYTYNYENNGKTVTAIDSLGRVSQVYKNDLGQVIKEVDAAGNMTEYFYEDERRNMTRKMETEVNGVEPITTRYTYNAFNKVETMTDSLGSEWLFTYDKQGNLSGTKDAEGNTVSHDYDISGRRTKTTKHLEYGTKIETTFTYHDNNKLKTITDAGNNTTTYEYDCLNNLKKTIYPDNTFTEYTYDKNSNVISEKQRNGTIVTNTYDALNRLTNRSITRAQGVAGTSFENYGYDALSRLTRAENDFSTIEMSYNILNQLTEEKQMGKTLNFTYDNMNNLKTIQYPNGRLIERDFDTVNRISKVKEGEVNIAEMSYVGRTYRMLNKQYGNGAVTNFLYDQGGRLTSKEVINANNDLINKYVYGYNNANMKTFEQRVHDNNLGDIFAYDEVNRLKSIKFNSPEPTVPETEQFEKQKSYLYDKLDNILTLVETQNEETSETTNTLTGVNYQLNQYTTFDEWGLSYDGNGNTAQKGTQHFTYDYRNQLISSTDLTTSVDYKYDAFGRRIEKSIGSNTTKYFYSANQVIEERDNSDQVLKQYIYGNGIDEIIRVDNYESGSPVPYYYHTNAIGSVTAITDDSGNLIERISYDTFGMPTFTDTAGETIYSSSIDNEYLFHGRRYDRETNLYYYRARYYDPIMGRFLQTDPMGYEDSMNLYQGFNMNPVNFVDPWGEKLFAAGDIQTVLGWLEGIAGVQGVLKTKQPTIANAALVNAKEVYLASSQAINKSSNVGLWLLDALIMSPTKYVLGLGETYPTAYSPPNRKFNPRTKEGTVGQHFKLNWKSNSVGGALNPPKGIDCVVWFYLDSKYLNKVKKRHDIVINFQRGEVHYAKSVSGETVSNGPLEKLYLFIFHELAEAYYELEENLPWGEAHQKAIDREMQLRRQRENSEDLRQKVDSGWLMREKNKK
jgi:RHS repeat-associated protein